MLARNRLKFKGGVMQSGGALAEGAADADAQSYQQHGSTGDELAKHMDATEQAANQIEGFQFQKGGYNCGDCNQVAGASDEQQQQICDMQAMECQQKVEAEYDYAMKGGYKYYPPRRGKNRSSSTKSKSEKEPTATPSHSGRSMKKRKGRRGKSLKDKSKKRKHKKKVKTAQKGGKKCGCKTRKNKRKLSKKNKRKTNKRKTNKRKSNKRGRK